MLLFTIADIMRVTIIIASPRSGSYLTEHLVETRREVVTRLTGLDYEELRHQRSEPQEASRSEVSTDPPNRVYLVSRCG
jgi:hypothetical protein